MQNEILDNFQLSLFSEVIDKEKVKKLLKCYCITTNVFALLTDAKGQWITDFVGAEKEVDRIKSYVSAKKVQQIIDRVLTSKIEDQVIENSEYPNLKIAAVSIKINGKPVLNGLICGIITDALEEGYEQEALEGFKTVTTSQRFVETIDFGHIFTKKILTYKYQLVDALAENKRIRSSHVEISESLRRNDTITSILQLLESEESIERVLAEILSYAGGYLKLSSAQVFRVHPNANEMDVVSEWMGKGFFSIFDKTQNIERPSILSRDKVLVISTDAMLKEEERKELQKSHIQATVVLPISINGKISMYACFNECGQERNWLIEEIRFASDVVKIIQSILVRRIQKNSLASSFASLEAILDNIGCSIYVWDPNRESVLFLNRELKELFAKKESPISEKDFFKQIGTDYKDGLYEQFDEKENLWYEIHKTHINWVDGREVVLCAIYDITDKKIYQKKIEQQAYTDFLTGLYNRMCCERDLARYIDDAKNEGTMGVLLYLDLDDFKHINDGLGHQYGDALLKAISHNLQRINGIESTCYRMGGDEFVILIPPDSYPKFSIIQDEIKEIFSKPWFLKDSDYYCTMSMGTVTFPKEGDSVQSLIKKADIAMYEAKKSGKNRVAHYSDSISSTSNKRLDMEKNMRDAMAGEMKEFEVYYQPITDIQMEGMPCTGAEALVRWNSAELGFLTPGAFIPLAEYLGLINQIGNHVLHEACVECKKWNDNGQPTYKVNVNLSVVQLLQNDMLEIIEQTIEKTGVNPRNLTLEVTESLAIDDMDRMKAILANIKKLGVRIALDDFGTGYSSLNHIRQIPLDVIKVDQTFVKDLAEDSYSQAFIKMVAELANTIGVSICVEGIETEEQYKVLEGMKVRLIQGYYFGKPMKKEEFEEKYIRK